MAALATLKKQIKTLQDFTKVVNIQKIVVMKEIAHWQKVIDKATSVRAIFLDLINRINKRYRVLPRGTFDANKQMKIPVERDLHFIFQGNISDAVSEYEFKLIEEFCRKNNKPNDIYYIVGKKLAKHLKDAGFTILSSMSSTDLDDPSIYRRISHLIFESYDDLIFKRSTLGFLDVATRQFYKTDIFPFSKDDIFKKEHLKGAEEFLEIRKIKLGSTTFIKDFDIVTRTLVRDSIESSIYLNIVKYSLAMKMRELQSLDDKEKNILAEIELVKLKMQRARKDAITNELLTNATAFEALSSEEDQ